MDPKKNVPPPVLRSIAPSTAGKSAEELSGVTAADYRRAKRCAGLLPVVIAVGGSAMVIVGVSETGIGRGWIELANKVILTVTVMVGGYLATQATRLKMKPFRDFKRETDLAEYRRRKV